MRKKTTEEFIKDAKKVHGNKYDYSKVDYVNANTKVCIMCPKHGKFEQRPYGHLAGNGCPTCGNKTKGDSKRSTKEEFIKKARKVHGDKYDYSNVKYIGALKKVCIICPEHGEFWQKPNDHLGGHGCHKCAGKYSPTTEEWIVSANEIHKGKYDYSKVKYVDAHTKVCIICPDHGEFCQEAYVHTKGCGCPICWQITVIDSKRSTKEDFIEKANEKHGSKYDYSNVKYVNCMSKVCIICPEHGEFWQSPDNHLHGCGCPKCNLSHLERNVMNYLDDIGITYDYQKRFKWLGRQSLDFYLSDYKIGIECQGIQHFEEIDYFGGKESLNECKKRDKLKFKKCQKNGIKVLYYSNLGIEYPYEVFEDVDLLFDEIKKQ